MFILLYEGNICTRIKRRSYLGYCLPRISSLHYVAITGRVRSLLLLEMKEVELGHNGTKGFPMIELNDDNTLEILMKIN
jgi:hypothetical protein